jgi:hypothetical protein
LTVLVAAILIVEALGTAVWMAAHVNGLFTFSALVLVVVAARALVAMLQFTGGWLLFSRRPQAPAIALAAVSSSAVLTTVDVWWRITPSDLDPSHRWVVIGIYLTWSALAWWYLRQLSRRAS